MKTAPVVDTASRLIGATMLAIVFFLSGTAALVFETLWFRLAALAFGSSVHASSLVLASFMAGLAMGSVLAARRGARLRRPVVAYVVLECLIGAVGLALVLLLPHLPRLLAPIWRPFLEAPITLHALRFSLSFLLLVLPTTAMGMTLPLLVKAMTRWRDDFGNALGTLYGVNTLGAMLGAILGEWFLIPLLGLTGSAAAATGLNLLAAAGALWLSQRTPSSPEPPHSTSPKMPLPPREPAALRLLLAAALSGAILLALEVVWFRFLQLFVLSTSRGFAIMLLVVLLGIGTGGLASSLWLRRRPSAYRLLPHLAVVAGLLTMGCYFGFASAPADASGARTVQLVDTLVLSLRLMFPVSFVSGLLFTLTGRAVFESVREETASVGWTTVFNTVGATLGAIVAGWALLPHLGIERSIFAAALGYGVVALLLAPMPRLAGASSRNTRLALAGLGGLYLLVCFLFPFGLMRNHYVPIATAGYRTPSAEIVEVREGLNETIVYMQERWMGEPYSSRLVTNSFSMTATGLRAERYMKFFAYWPLAFQPRIEKALILTYGFGITASVLTGSEEAARIDVVDVSQDVIDMGEHLYPDPKQRPIADPRVRVFIEDARFYLLTSEERYDLITGEPPPLMIASVVNLYTQEYFELMRERLNEGGLVTYWLPVVHLAPDDARSVIKAFCDVFEDCSLWQGARLELVLAGSRNAAGPVDEETFDRLWRDPETARDLRTIGFETPGLLLATFVGDARFLREFTRGASRSTTTIRTGSAPTWRSTRRSKIESSSTSSSFGTPPSWSGIETAPF